MIDPVEAMMKATSNLLVPTTSSKSPIAPIPTVIPTSLPIYETSTDTGVTTLWVVFVLMVIATIAFSVMAFRIPVQQRLFHIITAFITTFAAISYFAMATGDGNSFAKYVEVEQNQHVPDTTQVIYRQIYWARYVDWSITTPLLLLDLAFLAGLSGANILVAIVADLIMILTGLFAAFGKEGGQQWGYYAIACIAFLVIIYQLAVYGRQMAISKDQKTGTFFTLIAGYTLIVWTVYPIVWGIAEGSRKMTVDAEIISYAVVDILAKPIFGAWLLFTHASMPSTHISLEGFWAHGLSGEGSVRLDDDEGA
ncbi:MAG: hypothetical protein M1827_006640 [Pycnora praestabilis]|nr:MAG: hypothetical protein M1827_006640 [Pycnora praestabilis]